MIPTTALAVQQAGLIVIDQSLLYHFAIFMAVTFVLHHLVFKPMLQLQELRWQRTEGALAEARRLQEEAARAVADYEGRIEEARRQGMEEFARMREEALAEARALQEETAKRIEAAFERERAELERQYRKAREELLRQADEIGDLVAQRVLSTGAGATGSPPRAEA